MKSEETPRLIEEKVDDFATLIKHTLYRNHFVKGKGSWIGLDKQQLMLKLNEEILEFLEAIMSDDPDAITLEATDVAAMAMFIHDNFGRKDE